jgi:hypothetical protein
LVASIRCYMDKRHSQDPTIYNQGLNELS